MARERTAFNSLTMQICLVVLPLLVLLLFGIYFLRQDKLLVQNDAREKALELAQRTYFGWMPFQTNLSFYTDRDLLPETDAFFQLNPAAELLLPPPLTTNTLTSPIIATLTPSFSNLWLQAEQAEFILNDPAKAAEIWKSLAASEIPAPAKNTALFHHAILLEKSGRTNEALSLFESLRSTPLAHRSDSGLPLSHLAVLKIIEATDTNSNSLWELGWSFVLQPTEHSEFFLSQMHDNFPYIAPLWKQHQRARKLFAVYQTNSQAMPELNGEKWFFFPSDTNVFARSESALEQADRSFRESMNFPGYLAPVVVFQGKIFPPNATYDKSRLLASFSQPAFPIDFRTEVYLSNPSLLYARQRQRAFWLGSILALATLTATLGLVHITRSHAKQERLNQLKTNFVSSVSHELRAPLASMRLMSEALQGGRVHDPEKQREYFNYLVQECRRLSVLVENVLDFSRIDQNKKVYEFEPTDLRQVVNASIKTMAPVAAENQVKLDFDSAPDLNAEANIDAPAMQQAIVNLLDNAVKHSPPSATVSIRLDQSENELNISVSDQGPGIPSHEHVKIFDRFYRLGSELRRETPGVGIGLSIVKHIVEAHRGTIRVQSSPGAGATFTISLPKS